MKIKGVVLKDFAPFAPQSFRFGEKAAEGRRADVHIFVGENGTGKTRLLSLLLAACGNGKELADRQPTSANAGVFAEVPSGRGLLWTPKMLYAFAAAHLEHGAAEFLSSGNLGQTPGKQAVGQGPLQKGGTMAPALAFNSMAAIRGGKISPMAPVPWKPEEFLLFARQPNDDAALSQAVANLKIRAGMYLAGNPEGKADRTVRTTERLEAMLMRITGRKFIFIVEQEGKEVSLKVSWGGTRMKIQQLPDGLRAIIGWLVACVAKLDLLLPGDEDPLQSPVTLFLDEPESHLHPAW